MLHAPRRIWFVAPLLALALLATLVPQQAKAAGTLAWPHFLKIHVEDRRADTRVIVDTAWSGAGIRWVSQPGVEAGDHLVRVDQSGFVRSLDAKLAFTKAGAAQGNGLIVRIQAPGLDGVDSFPFTPGNALKAQTPSKASTGGNAVDDVQPYVPHFSAPLDFTINVAGICRPNQYLQVAPEWTNAVWRTPDGTPPGTYRVRLNADGTVSSLDGKIAWNRVQAQPWDWGHQILGVLIVHSCDPTADGADVVGFGRHPEDGSFDHMTTWAQQPDGGYGWQPFNCGMTGVCASQPRPDGFFGGNWIVRSQPAPTPPPLNLTPTRINAGSLPAVSVAASAAQFSAGQAKAAVLARFDRFADALAGIPLALHEHGPLLLSSPTGVEAEVIRELQRTLPSGGTVYLLGGEQALSANVAATLQKWGFQTVRLAGDTRVETAVEIAKAIGPVQHAFVVNAWNFPDALAAGAAAGAVDGGAHVLLTDATALPDPTRSTLANGDYRDTTVFGGTTVVSDTTAQAAHATDRVAGARTVWVADGNDFVAGITGGAMAAADGGPLLLSSGGLGDATRSYLKDTKPGAAYVVGGLDDGVVRQWFGQAAR